MRRSLRYLRIALVISSAWVAHVRGESPSDKSKTIPLDKIWAYEMPGTKDVRDLEPKKPTAHLSNQEFIKSSQVQQILQMLSSRELPKEGRQAGPAILVKGSGMEALNNARDALSNKGKHQSTKWFPAAEDLSLLFYSYTVPRYVRIVDVERSEKEMPSGGTETELKVQYRFITQFTTDLTSHFALIPLGQVKPGVSSED